MAQNKNEQNIFRESITKAKYEKRTAHNINKKIYFSQTYQKKKKKPPTNSESKIVSIPLASNSSIWKSMESVAQKQIYLNWAHFHPPATVSF